MGKSTIDIYKSLIFHSYVRFTRGYLIFGHYKPPWGFIGWPGFPIPSPRNELSKRRAGREAAEVLGFHKHPWAALDSLSEESAGTFKARKCYLRCFETHQMVREHVRTSFESGQSGRCMDYGLWASQGEQGQHTIFKRMKMSVPCNILVWFSSIYSLQKGRTKTARKLP